MVYKTPTGTLKDNFVIWHEGKFYLVAMYREQVPGGEEHWNDAWLATSTDGVHWKDVGPVIHDAPFIVYSMAIHKVGNRFILNHGSLTGPNVDVVRFWQSDDLVHWTYLGKEYDARRPDGKRLDSMDVLAVERDGRTQWFGYATGGLFRSEDGVRWKWQEDYRLSDNNWDVGETGGCALLGGKYYLLGGNHPQLGGKARGLPGDASYDVLTFLGEKPEGPFRPDYQALRLTGNSSRKSIAIWSRFCRTPQDTLLSNYITDPRAPAGEAFWWHAPLKKAVVDADGHLRPGYWSGNDAMKGDPIAIRPRDCAQVFPSPGGDKAKAALAVEGDVARLTMPAGGASQWFAYDRPRTAVALLGERFDPEKGFVLEGRMKIEPLGCGQPGVGLYFEERSPTGQRGTAALLSACRRTEMGTIHLDNDARFDAEDHAGYGCATVTGIVPGTACSFRVLFRKDMFEFYLNDLLVQTYCVKGATGRVGFVVRDGQASFDDLRAWKMNLQD